MFQRKIYIDSDSYVEVSSRVHEGEEKLMLTIAGPKNEKETTMVSAILTDAHAALLAKCLDEGLRREVSWEAGKELGSEE